MRTLLSPEESKRASRYRFDVDHRQFVVGRVILRSLLAMYLNMDASQISFCYGSFGKPRLAPDLQAANLEFNLSHSEDMLILAVAGGRSVGVDLEHVRRAPDVMCALDSFLTAAEIRAMRLNPTAEKSRQCLRAWIRKEALVKADGRGLHFSLDQLETIHLLPALSSACSYAHSALVPQSWRLWDLALPGGYLGTVVAADDGSDLHIRVQAIGHSVGIGLDFTTGPNDSPDR
ncbi:MAG: 4'-phosphopantetheinyl transferase superfamily protein [Rhodocyclaceae bacterium]|nr:4'-phosphopantetheinyl transferase superfamily protein [Rhodocyclaceae bacterium]MCP5311404.1 4'-phosphopantetheinyl transferase superfamily protein [Zoogloeaceae bacterium]MCP5426635.1 4'-phosphopantetheinyl transferase superfamily protein [Chromatiaceae bacterium]